MVAFHLDFIVISTLDREPPERLMFPVSTAGTPKAHRGVTAVWLMDGFLSEWDGLYVTSYEFLIPNHPAPKNAQGFSTWAWQFIIGEGD